MNKNIVTKNLGLTVRSALPAHIKRTVKKVAREYIYKFRRSPLEVQQQKFTVAYAILYMRLHQRHGELPDDVLEHAALYLEQLYLRTSNAPLPTVKPHHEKHSGPHYVATLHNQQAYRAL